MLTNTYDTQSVDTSLFDQKKVIDGFVEAARILKRRETNPYPDDEIPTGLQNKYVIPHASTYAGVYNWYQKYYYNYFDESLINSVQNSIAMRRDAFIHELLRHRQLPTVALNHALEVDDPDDDEQVKVKKQVAKVIDDLPYFQSMKLQLLEALYYGKSGSQLLWGKKKISGRTYNTVLNHEPVQGDKIVYKYDGTPGIMVFAGDPNLMSDPRSKNYIESIDKGTALFLHDEYYRDCFVIHEFERTDTDYLFETDKALAVHGLGIRDRMYWAWNMRAELIGWMFNALQRVGANGMLYAFFQSGNPTAMQETMAALRNLIQENIAAFPMQANEMIDKIQHIDVSGVGYEVLYQLIQHFEEIMRRAVLGQNLSSQSAATGLGSGVADLQAGTFENIIIYDSSCLAETLDQQLVKKIIKFNKWEYEGKFYNGEDLPFNIRLKLQVNKQNVSELVQAATALAQLGVPLDMENLRDQAGLMAPRNKANTLVMPGGVNGQTDNAGAIKSETGRDGGNPKEQAPKKTALTNGNVRGDTSGRKMESFADDVTLENFARDHTDPSVMISLTIPNEVARTLTIPGGEKENDLHITVCYLGRLSEIGQDAVDDALQVAELLADNSRPISGLVGGFGRFSASDSSDGKDVIYANVDLPRLPDFRGELIHVLNLAKIPYKNNHGYTPHVTLKYIDSDRNTPVKRIPNSPVTFHFLRVTVGEEIHDFPFSEDPENFEIDPDDIEPFAKGGPNCGIGSKGFEKGNDCAKGTGGINSQADARRYVKQMQKEAAAKAAGKDPAPTPKKAAPKETAHVPKKAAPMPEPGDKAKQEEIERKYQADKQAKLAKEQEVERQKTAKADAEKKEQEARKIKEEAAKKEEVARQEKEKAAKEEEAAKKDDPFGFGSEEDEEVKESHLDKAIRENREKIISRFSDIAKSYGFNVDSKGSGFISRVKGEESLKSNIAVYYYGGNSIVFNETNSYYDNPKRAMVRMGNSGWLSSDHEDHVVIHEIGHGLHFKNVGLDRFRELQKSPVPLDIRLKVKSEVSSYAATNNLEVVAEMFAGMKFGKKYSDELMNYYDSIGGMKV